MKTRRLLLAAAKAKDATGRASVRKGLVTAVNADGTYTVFGVPVPPAITPMQLSVGDQVWVEFFGDSPIVILSVDRRSSSTPPRRKQPSRESGVEELILHNGDIYFRNAQQFTALNVSSFIPFAFNPPRWGMRPSMFVCITANKFAVFRLDRGDTELYGARRPIATHVATYDWPAGLELCRRSLSADGSGTQVFNHARVTECAPPILFNITAVGTASFSTSESGSGSDVVTSDAAGLQDYMLDENGHVIIAVGYVSTQTQVSGTRTQTTVGFTLSDFVYTPSTVAHNLAAPASIQEMALIDCTTRTVLWKSNADTVAATAHRALDEKGGLIGAKLETNIIVEAVPIGTTRTFFPQVNGGSSVQPDQFVTASISASATRGMSSGAVNGAWANLPSLQPLAIVGAPLSLVLTEVRAPTQLFNSVASVDPATCSGAGTSRVRITESLTQYPSSGGSYDLLPRFMGLPTDLNAARILLVAHQLRTDLVPSAGSLNYWALLVINARGALVATIRAPWVTRGTVLTVLGTTERYVCWALRDNVTGEEDTIYLNDIVTGIERVVSRDSVGEQQVKGALQTMGLQWLRRDVVYAGREDQRFFAQHTNLSFLPSQVDPTTFVIRNFPTERVDLAAWKRLIDLPAGVTSPNTSGYSHHVVPVTAGA